MASDALWASEADQLPGQIVVVALLGPRPASRTLPRDRATEADLPPSPIVVVGVAGSCSQTPRAVRDFRGPLTRPHGDVDVAHSQSHPAWRLSPQRTAFGLLA